MVDSSCGYAGNSSCGMGLGDGCSFDNNSQLFTAPPVHNEALQLEIEVTDALHGWITGKTSTLQILPTVFQVGIREPIAFIGGTYNVTWKCNPNSDLVNASVEVYVSAVGSGAIETNKITIHIKDAPFECSSFGQTFWVPW